MTPDETLAKASETLSNAAAKLIKETPKSQDHTLAIARALDAAAATIFVRTIGPADAAEYYYRRADQLADQAQTSWQIKP